MAALDLLGRRWALRVLWELRDGTRSSFRELRERCDQMSTSVLNQRLAELRDAGLVEQATAATASQDGRGAAGGARATGPLGQALGASRRERVSEGLPQALSRRDPRTRAYRNGPVAR